MKDIVREAARRAGGVPALAQKLGMSKQAVYQWDKIPLDKVDAVARATGLERRRLRPDIFSQPAEQQPDYDTDFVAWALSQAACLREGRFETLDVGNLADEVEDMAQGHKDEIESRLAKLLSHLLKWRFQPGERSPSWASTILEQRARIARRIERSPSLRPYPAAVLEAEYGLARREAALETGLPLDLFPSECPFDIADVLDLDFLPAPTTREAESLL